MSDGAAPQPAGWYPDPQNPYLQRWWNGSAWTEDASPIHVVPDATEAATVVDDGPTAARNRIAVWGFVLALVSLPVWILSPYVSIDIAVAALVLGIIGLRRAKVRGKGFGLALAAVIIGAFQALGGFVILVTMQLTGLG
jgi:Protein of unknown function (DUF2510)